MLPACRLICALSAAFPLPAASVFLSAGADTTLIESAPTNNLGAQFFFNAGTTMSGTRNRGLFRFDFEGIIPPGSLVTRAEIHLDVVKHPPFEENPASSTFALHRLLKAWGEGDKIPARSPGLGLEATAGEATWTHRFALTTNTWGIPGGAPNVDYDVFSSSDQFVEFLDTYIFPSREETLADVQFWIDHPELNFGYLLRSRQESTLLTARQFGAHEDPLNAPFIRIDFVPFRLEQIELDDNGVRFNFPAREQTAYCVEFRESFSTAQWNTLTNVPPLPMATTVQITDTLSPNRRFYRVSQ